MTLVRIMSGSETFASGSSSVSAQVVHGGRLEFVSDAAKKSTAGVSVHGRPVYTAASRTGMREQGGWFDGSFSIPDDTVIRIQGRRTQRLGGRNGISRGVSKGVVYIKVRASAALRRLRLYTIEDEQSVNVPVVIEGRFDLLSLREAGTLGAPLSADDLTTGKVAAVQEVFEHTVISGQTQAQSKTVVARVKDADGKEVAVKTTHVPRAIDLGD